MPGFWGYVITSLATLGVGGLTYLGVRFTARSANTATKAVDSATWERLYRHNAEQHLKWDMTMMSRLKTVEHKLGIDEPLPDPPPLFPDVK